MIKHFSAIALLYSLLSIYSPSSLASDNVDDERALLAGIFPTSCHFSGQFLQQKNIQGLPVPLQSDGDFFYSCDLGLVWSTKAPFQEAILYVNSAKNYRIDEQGEIKPLTGIARYIMSNVFVKLLKGDVDYFADEFVVTATENQSIELKPESEFMQKGVESIQFSKTQSPELGVALMVDVIDATGQVTQVGIDEIIEHDIEGKRSAFEQCEKLYQDTTKWCSVLRSPSRFEKF